MWSAAATTPLWLGADTTTLLPGISQSGVVAAAVHSFLVHARSATSRCRCAHHNFREGTYMALACDYTRV